MSTKVNIGQFEVKYYLLFKHVINSSNSKNNKAHTFKADSNNRFTVAVHTYLGQVQNEQQIFLKEFWSADHHLP